MPNREPWEEAYKQAQDLKKKILKESPELSYIKPTKLVTLEQAKKIYESCTTPRDDRFLNNLKAAVTKERSEE